MHVDYPSALLLQTEGQRLECLPLWVYQDQLGMDQGDQLMDSHLQIHKPLQEGDIN